MGAKRFTSSPYVVFHYPPLLLYTCNYTTIRWLMSENAVTLYQRCAHHVPRQFYHAFLVRQARKTLHRVPVSEQLKSGWKIGGCREAER
jgi:hypothetical protein